MAIFAVPTGTVGDDLSTKGFSATGSGTGRCQIATGGSGIRFTSGTGNYAYLADGSNAPNSLQDQEVKFIKSANGAITERIVLRFSDFSNFIYLRFSSTLRVYASSTSGGANQLLINNFALTNGVEYIFRVSGNVASIIRTSDSVVLQTYDDTGLNKFPTTNGYPGVHNSASTGVDPMFSAWESRGVGETAGGAISGSTTYTVTPAGTLAGSGTLGGAATYNLSPVGILKGAGQLSGAAAFTLSPAGILKGAAALQGSAAYTLSPVGVLAGAGKLAGASTFTFTPTGLLSAPAALSGSTGLTWSPEGILRGSGRLTGATTLTWTPAAFLAGNAPIAGAAALTLDAAGALKGAAAASGSTTVTFQAEGFLSALVPISASTTITFTVSGTLRVAGWQFTADDSPDAFETDPDTHTGWAFTQDAAPAAWN